MKLRNLIFSLFLAIGAIGFTACTGDDGTTGPAGPAGPQGPPGEPGDAGDSGDATNFYPFLTSWGSETGEIGCDDSLLTSTAAFPGPEELHAIAETGQGNLDFPSDPAGLNNPIEVTCGNTLFDETALPAEGNPTINADGDATATGLVFVKTGRAMMTEDPVSTSQNDIDPARRVSTTKMFVGGTVHADLSTTGGNDEAFERSKLYSDCGVGAAPSAIMGDWRGVRIAQNVKAYRGGVQVNADGTPVADGGTAVEVNIVTTKVCVRLNAHPGIVKCFINITGNPVATDNARMIAYYDAEAGATAVKQLVDTDAAPGGNGTLSDDFSNTPQFLFGTADTTPEADLSANDVEQLCNLFDESLTNSE